MHTPTTDGSAIPSPSGSLFDSVADDFSFQHCGTTTSFETIFCSAVQKQIGTYNCDDTPQNMLQPVSPTDSKTDLLDLAMKVEDSMAKHVMADGQLNNLVGCCDSLQAEIRQHAAHTDTRLMKWRRDVEDNCQGQIANIEHQIQKVHVQGLLDLHNRLGALEDLQRSAKHEHHTSDRGAPTPPQSVSWESRLEEVSRIADRAAQDVGYLTRRLSASEKVAQEVRCGVSRVSDREQPKVSSSLSEQLFVIGARLANQQQGGEASDAPDISYEASQCLDLFQAEWDGRFGQVQQGVQEAHRQTSAAQEQLRSIAARLDAHEVVHQDLRVSLQELCDINASNCIALKSPDGVSEEAAHMEEENSPDGRVLEAVWRELARIQQELHSLKVVAMQDDADEVVTVRDKRVGHPDGALKLKPEDTGAARHESSLDSTTEGSPLRSEEIEALQQQLSLVAPELRQELTGTAWSEFDLLRREFSTLAEQWDDAVVCSSTTGCS